ncbi:MAG: hypothetical protein LV473_21025 [Nitrospira sp.]|nr:hypothetical protein [Nitrospira sp.]
MQITEERWKLAYDLLSLRKKLGGQRFTPDDVERVARGIARRAWREQQLTH